MPSPEPLDLLHLGSERAIGCYLLGTDDGPALQDCGPATCVPELKARLRERGLELRDLRHLLLSHIHLDHAGATGTLVREHPGLQVHVSEIGAPHLADPARLDGSARRLYGDEFERLWGELVPVPDENLHPAGAEVCGRECFRSPGHASHHVCYLHEESGTAFVGDVAAVRIPGVDLLVPPTTPPDIDVETWEESIGVVESWAPERLALTHFGQIDDPAPHLAAVRERLHEEARLARELPEDEYEKRHRDRVAAHAESEEAAAEMIQCVQPEYQWRGLDRYWSKRGTHEAA
jgi:glyoxylase-like metal-dependent hydrolase (beta-lactamase superfamily II)